MISTESGRDRNGFAFACAYGSAAGVYVRAYDAAITEEFVRNQAAQSVEDIESGRIVVELHDSRVTARSVVMSGTMSRAAWRVR